MLPEGYSKDDFVKIARQLAGETIDAEVEENDLNFNLKLWRTEKSLSAIETCYEISKVKHRNDQHKEIELAIQRFSTELIDSLIGKWNLEQHYKNKYAQTDKNLIYKVNRFYETKMGNIHYRQDFFLDQAQQLRELLPAYEPLLGMLLKTVTQHENEQELEECLHAIACRSEQLFFAHKIISEIISSGKTDASSLFVFDFHLYNFISLVKTLGDNLAWLLKLYLKLQFEDPQDIDLLSKRYRSAVADANPRIASLIYDNPQFSKFESLKGYRDIIQHRHKNSYTNNDERETCKTKNSNPCES